MFIASQKRKENIAEYLIYMWQIEDIIRASGLDIDKLQQTVIDPSPLTSEQKKELRQWYESLIDMMRREEVSTSGHLQINRNTLSQLVDMHRQLLADPKETEYQAQFYKTLPFIVELRAKAGGYQSGEIETCFNALYGLLLMRLQHKTVSPETQSAFDHIARLLAMLAAKFHEKENKPED